MASAASVAATKAIEDARRHEKVSMASAAGVAATRAAAAVARYVGVSMASVAELSRYQPAALGVVDEDLNGFSSLCR